MTKFTLEMLRVQPAEQKSISLPFPADHKVRIAQLTETPRFAGVVTFVPERWLELESFRPKVIVGYASELQRLAEQVDLGIVDLACVNHAIVVLTPCGSSPLSDVLRVVLWQSFGVPLFELFVGPDQTLLASECEAHDGWHLEPGVELGAFEEELILDSPGNYGLRTSLSGRVIKEPCPCGRETPRLMEIAAVRQRPLLRALSASA
jgi:hypothetical protein